MCTGNKISYLAVLPAVLFCVRHFESSRDAFVSGLLAGPMAMIPTLFLYLPMAGFYPAITDIPVPVFWIIQELDMPLFATAFQIVIYGTFVETGAGLIHGFNERLADTLSESNRVLPEWTRSAIGVMLLTVSVYLATTIGLIDLIAKGYGYSTYLFLALIALPVLIRGGYIVIVARQP